MTSAALSKPRARRIAADEAHAWARNLRLHNSYAKLVLSMLTLYVDGEGVCFVSIPSLAEDTELAPDTVRRRLGWLETVGAITRFACWIDETGRRNKEGNGRRTSDEIRLMINADPEEIEARALGNGGDGDSGGREADPRSQQGSAEDTSQIDPSASARVSAAKNLSRDSVSPLATPALRPGPNDSEPEPEANPPTPLRGEGQADLERESEAKIWPHVETWAKFESAWKEPILHQQLCRQIWTAFTDGERETAIKVARGYCNWLAKQKKPPNRCNPQKLLREREAWPQFVDLAGPDPTLRTFIVKDSAPHKAILVLSQIGGWLPPVIAFDAQEAADGYWRDRPPPADLVGLAVFAEKPIDDWLPLDRDATEFKAWAARIHGWLGRWPTTLRVPCKFPPRKDGSINPSDVPLATNDDVNQFGKAG